MKRDRHSLKYEISAAVDNHIQEFLLLQKNRLGSRVRIDVWRLSAATASPGGISPFIRLSNSIEGQIRQQLWRRSWEIT